jgi:hypothetical protein
LVNLAIYFEDFVMIRRLAALTLEDFDLQNILDRFLDY